MGASEPPDRSTTADASESRASERASLAVGRVAVSIATNRLVAPNERRGWTGPGAHPRVPDHGEVSS